MRSLRTAPGLVLLVMVVTLAIVGASSGDDAREFTKDDFKTIVKETPEAKVAETLGKPKESIDLGVDGKSLYYESKGSYYHVFVKDGKVAKTTALKDKAEYDKALGFGKALKELKDKIDKGSR